MSLDWQLNVIGYKEITGSRGPVVRESRRVKRLEKLQLPGGDALA
jgi:hypothetical protein